MSLFSFSHYFTTRIIYFLLYGVLNVLVTNFENMVAKQNHHFFSFHIPYIFCMRIHCVAYLEEHEQALVLKTKHVPGEKKGIFVISEKIIIKNPA